MSFSLATFKNFLLSFLFSRFATISLGVIFFVYIMFSLHSSFKSLAWYFVDIEKFFILPSNIFLAHSLSPLLGSGCIYVNIFPHFIYLLLLLCFIIFFFLPCFRLFSLVLSSRIRIFYPAVFYLTLNPLVLNFGDWGFSYRIPICLFFCKSLLRFSEILIFSQFILLLVFTFVNCSCILVCLIDKYWLISGYWAMKLKGTFKALNGVLFVLVEFTFDFGRQIIAVASLNLSLIWFQAGF